MQQQISVITLGVADLARSRRFYIEGFGWKPVFENSEIAFYQMNGLMLGTWHQAALEADMRRTGLARPGAFALAHNVASEREVGRVIERLAQAGGRVLRPGDAPPHGGFRGYVADPDDHAWEIAWNPAWAIDDRGWVTFGKPDSHAEAAHRLHHRRALARMPAVRGAGHPWPKDRARGGRIGPLSSLQVKVWRGDADGRYETFEVPHRTSQTVLDIVTYIQRHLDPTLSYRFACRVGVCGSCAMTVNGVPRWTCRTHVDRVAKDRQLEIAPLRNLPVVKDLAADMRDFFDKWARAKGQFQPPAAVPADFVRVDPASARRREADAAIECIGCAVCYSACDVVSWNPDYLGPAALNRAWSLVNDERDAGNRERLSAVAGDAGCHACHSHQACAERCPKHLNPTGAIAGLKRATLRAALGGAL